MCQDSYIISNQILTTFFKETAHQLNFNKKRNVFQKWGTNNVHTNRLYQSSLKTRRESIDKLHTHEQLNYLNKYYSNNNKNNDPWEWGGEDGL